jgi:class 3 adenylate cyclase
LIDLFLEPRRSPDVRLRTAWWVAAFTVILSGWAISPIRLLVTAVWATVNLIYLLAAIGWSMFHPRSVLGGREISLRWSVLLTLLAALILFSQIYSFMEDFRPTDEGATNTAGVMMVVTILMCPLLFGLILGLGILGAMVGAFANRHCSEARKATQSAVVFWFSAWMTLAMWASFSQHRSDLRQLYGLSIPLLTVGFCRLAYGPDAPLKRLGHRLVAQIERVLILRKTRRGRWRALDLRGAALGLLASVLMLAAPLTLMAPLKTLALVTLMQIRASTFPRILQDVGQVFGKLPHRDDIVILTMDPATRYRILHGGSEAAVQAEMIDRLTRWGARRIVLPSPLIHIGRYYASTDNPAPDDAAIERCRHDIPRLAAAIQHSGKVLVTLPPLEGRVIRAGSDPEALTDPDLALLYAHAAVAQSDLPLSPVVHLPIIPARLKPTESTYVPIDLSRSVHNIKDNTGVDRDTQTDSSVFAGVELPQITPEGALVNFLGQGPRYDFTHLSYSALLSNEMIHANPPGSLEAAGESRWQTPAQYFHRGQVVLLDSVQHPLELTPLGVMSQADVLAYATATLLSGESIRPVTTVSQILVTLFIGLTIAAACFRRDPVDAIWRATIPMFLVSLISLCLFLFGGIWLDPVLPLGASLIALAMVTQLSFAQERSERRRTRALFQRFVASDQLDNWLTMPEDALALGGKRQTVCVLFADVRNFTHFAEQNEADKVIEVINVYMSGLTEALHRHGGVLDKYTGDGLMAWFPVSENLYDDLKNAVHAALAMRDAGLTISAQMPPEEQLDIGFGLHYGDAVVGLVGSEKLQINWTALGHTVVVSARLQTIALGGEVVISENLYEIVAGSFSVVESAPVMVKGLSTPVRPYRVIEAAPGGNLAVAPTTTPQSLPAPPTSPT